MTVVELWLWHRLAYVGQVIWLPNQFPEQHRSEPTQKQYVYVAKGDHDHPLPNNTRCVSLDPEPFISGTTFPLLSITPVLFLVNNCGKIDFLIKEFPNSFASPTRFTWYLLILYHSIGHGLMVNHINRILKPFQSHLSTICNKTLQFFHWHDASAQMSETKVQPKPNSLLCGRQPRFFRLILPNASITLLRSL